MKRGLIGVLVLLLLLGNVAFVGAQDPATDFSEGKGLTAGAEDPNNPENSIKDTKTVTSGSWFDTMKTSMGTIGSFVGDWWNNVYNKGKTKALASLCSYFPGMSSCPSSKPDTKTPTATMDTSGFKGSTPPSVPQEYGIWEVKVWSTKSNPTGLSGLELLKARDCRYVDSNKNGAEVPLTAKGKSISWTCPPDETQYGKCNFQKDNDGYWGWKCSNVPADTPIPSEVILDADCLGSRTMWMGCNSDSSVCSGGCTYEMTPTNIGCWMVMTYEMDINEKDVTIRAKTDPSKTTCLAGPDSDAKVSVYCSGSGPAAGSKNSNGGWDYTSASGYMLCGTSPMKWTATFRGYSPEMPQECKIVDSSGSQVSLCNQIERTATPPITSPTKPEPTNPDPETPETPGTATPTTPGKDATDQTAEPNCKDKIKNGDETSVDCGGETCEARCDFGGGCTVTKDCKAGLSCLGTTIKACGVPEENKKILNFNKPGFRTNYSYNYGGRVHFGNYWTVEIAFVGTTPEGEFTGLPVATDSMGGVSAILYAGADAAFTPSTIKNTYGNSFNPTAKVNTSDNSITATVRNVNGVNVVDLKVADDASGNKTITVDLTGKDNQGNTVPIGTAKINAEIRPAPSSSQIFVISGIILGSLLSIGILAWMYFKQSASSAIQMLTP